MHKDNQLTINTINCKGLGDCNIRQDIFNYLRKKKFNIYFLQDTFVEKQKELENIRKSKMKGKAVRARVKWIDE
jgi:hypothetical protein